MHSAGKRSLPGDFLALQENSQFFMPVSLSKKFSEPSVAVSTTGSPQPASTTSNTQQQDNAPASVQSFKTKYKTEVRK